MIEVMKALMFSLGYVLPGTAFIGLWKLGNWIFLTPIFAYFFIPIIDTLFPEKRSNPTLQQMEGQKNFPPQLIIYLYIPIHFLLTIYAAFVTARGFVTWIEFLGVALTVGTVNGAVGFVIIHELIHKKNRWENFLGKLMLIIVSYMHYYIEHLQIHHVHLGTAKDPSSALLGESFYAFFFRAVRKPYLDCWKHEWVRLQRLGYGNWNYCYRNQMFWFTVLPISFAGLLGFIFGPLAVPFFFLQSFIAIWTFELGGYIQHYGLQRKEIAPGRYERVTSAHSWNTYLPVSSYMTFQLTRHSDHHCHPTRQYNLLHSYEESPTLPFGYPVMVALAMIPPLWRRIMDPRLNQF